MVTIELTRETGWVSFPADTETYVAHYSDGHTEKLSSFAELLMKTRKRNHNIVSVDCYGKGEYKNL